MVERPIKKSERQSQANTDNKSEQPDSVPPVESNYTSPKLNNNRSSSSSSSKPSDNRSSGKGKKASLGDDNKQQVNPALARGPKPMKPKINVKSEPETESEPNSEESQDENS